MAEPHDRSRQADDAAPEIAADDAGVSAAGERLHKARDERDADLTDGDRAMAAMASRHDRFAGSAVGAGSVGFDEFGVYTSADGAMGKDEDDELLVDGQEEVFSRTEVESGRIEHHAGEDDPRPPTRSRG